MKNYIKENGGIEIINVYKRVHDTFTVSSIKSYLVDLDSFDSEEQLYDFMLAHLMGDGLCWWRYTNEYDARVYWSEREREAAI